MTKPQHEQDYEVVLTADLDPSQLASLDRLHAEAAKVPGLEAQAKADWKACCEVLVWACQHPLNLPPPNRALTALLERLAKAEAERDAAEARVKELEAQVAGARNAALEEAAEVAVSAPSSDHAHRRILHLKSQPPSAPAQGVDEDVATVRDALDVFYQRSEANYSKDRARWNSAVDALERLASRPATPTTPALVEAVGPFIELGDRVADTVALKDPNAVVAHICDDGCHYREVKVRDFQRLRAAYDAAKGGGK